MLTTDRLDLRPFERRPQEVLLRKDVLDRQLIDVDGARLRRANDIELARLDGWWRVVGVDVGPRGIVRRVVPRRYARAARGEARRGARLGRRRAVHRPRPDRAVAVPHPKLGRLHPAQIADLVEAAATAEGEEILAAVHDDPELEADLFEELARIRGPASCSRDRTDDEIAAVLARMESDDAVDLLAELDEERRRRAFVELLPSPSSAGASGALLGYAPRDRRRPDEPRRSSACTPRRPPRGARAGPAGAPRPRRSRWSS